jgi:hypothetical protein
MNASRSPTSWSLRGGKTMVAARIDLEGRARYELGRKVGRCADWHDLVVVAVDDQRQDVEPLQVP